MMFYKQCNYFSYALLAAISTFVSITHIKPIEPKHYKGTIALFKPNKHYLSGVDGILEFERFGSGRWYLALSDRATATQKLCKQLSHSNYPGDFNVTQLRKNAAFHLTPQIIGNIISILESSSENKHFDTEDLKNNLFKTISQNKAFQESTRKTSDEYHAKQQEAAQEMESLKNRNNEIDNLIKKSKAILDPKFQKLKSIIPDMGIKAPSNLTANSWMTLFEKAQCTKDHASTYSLVKELKEIWGKFTEDQQPLIREKATNKDKLDDLKRNITHFLYQEKSLEILIDTIIESCKESGIIEDKNSTILFTKHTPYRILQAYLYAKFSGKEALDAYHQELNQFQTNSNKTLQETSCDYEKAVITQFSPATLPLFDKYQSFLSYEQEGKKYKVGASDCVDNVIRHLTSILAYDSVKKSFNIDKLTSYTAPGKEVNAQILQFFSSFTTPEKANSTEGHQSWFNIISNIKGIGYAQAVDVDTGSIISMKLPVFAMHKSMLSNIENNLPLKLERFHYEPKDDSKYLLCETVTSIRNIIVALNELLGLNLFDLNDQNFLTSKEGFLSPDFVENYWSKLCERCNWIPENEDEFDPTDKSISITLLHQLSPEQQGRFTIKIFINSNDASAQIEVTNPISPSSNDKKIPLNSLESLLYHLTTASYHLNYFTPTWKCIEQIESSSLLQKEKDLLFTDTCTAHFHEIIKKGLKRENIVNIIQNIKRPLQTTLLAILKSIGSTQKSLLNDSEVINALLEHYKKSKDLILISTIYKNSAAFYTAIKKCGNQTLLSNILYSAELFPDDFLKVALEHDNLDSQLETIFSSQYLLSQKQVIEKLKSIQTKKPQFFLQAFILNDLLEKKSLITLFFDDEESLCAQIRKIPLTSHLAIKNMIGNASKLPRSFINTLLQNSSIYESPYTISELVDNYHIFTFEEFYTYIKQAHVAAAMILENLPFGHKRSFPIARERSKEFGWNILETIRTTQNKKLLKNILVHDYNDDEKKAALENENIQIKHVIEKMSLQPCTNSITNEFEAPSIFKLLPQDQTHLITIFEQTDINVSEQFISNLNLFTKLADKRWLEVALQKTQLQ